MVAVGVTKRGVARSLGSAIIGTPGICGNRAGRSTPSGIAVGGGWSTPISHVDDEQLRIKIRVSKVSRSDELCEVESVEELKSCRILF